MEVTTARILDKRRMLKKSKTYKLAIRVTFNRKPVPFPVDLHLSEKDFNKLNSPRLGKELSEIRDKFLMEEKRAKEIIQRIGTFTFQAFKEEFYKHKLAEKIKHGLAKRRPVQDVIREQLSDNMIATNEGKNKKYGQRKFDRIRSNVNYTAMGPLAVAFGDYIRLLEAQERIGTSECYFTTLMNLLRFKSSLRFEDVTITFLYEYERWMLSHGRSLTTIGIYLRALRSIFNMQIAENQIPQACYPFGKRKYQIPTGANVKKALELSDIKKIYDYSPQSENKNEAFAKDIWLFGYFSNGINIKDIAYLKYINIDEDFLIIKREKTKFTTRSKPKNILIPINDDMRAIIERWGNKDKDADNYIFPVLENGLSAHRKRELVQCFTTIVNKWMKKIAENAGIKKKVLTMTYRHSYATVLKRAGVSSEFIKEQLGHTDLQTTENYLDSFELDIKRKFSSNLLAFKEIGISD
jgi:integrase/recombinase XerD